MQNVIQENPSVWKLNVIDAHEVPAVYWPMRTCVLRLFNGAVVGQIIYCVSFGIYVLGVLTRVYISDLTVANDEFQLP